ncbi:MAG: hypothetical protein Q9182_002759 [Xanthomendoza sp. 2 TL-2023]
MKTLLAPILGLVVATTASVLSPRAVNCNGRKFKLTVENWKDIKADESIRAFWEGKRDAEDVKWPGAHSYSQPKEFTTLLGTKLQNKPTWSCSGLPLEITCDAEPCTAIGRYNKAGEMVSEPSRWGLLALYSVMNLHRWISQIYEGINIGQQGASNAAFGIATDFSKPKEEPNLWFKDLFAAVSSMLGSLGSIPGTSFGPAVNGANAVQGLIGTEIGLHLKGPPVDQNFQTASQFSKAIRMFADQARQGLEVANNRILNSADDTTLQVFPHLWSSSSIDNVRNIISGGRWLNTPPVDQTAVGEFFRRNMIARGINAVWRSYPVYVYYVWLDDAGAKPGDKGTKCDLDRSGPQALKYCADEGVYYLYMYNGRGIDWPWGGPKLAGDDYKINPIWAVESSARSFKAQGINYDPSKADSSQFLGFPSITDFINSPERLEGTWTLPVCDGSSNIGFNTDYLNQRKVDLKDGVGMPPCMCGIDGRDTATFVKAANLDSKKMARMCFDAYVRGGTGDWPAAVDVIAYGEDGKNKVSKKAIDKCIKTSGASNPSYCTDLN